MYMGKVHGNLHVPLHVWCMNVPGKAHGNLHVPLHASCMKVQGKGISKFACTFTLSEVHEVLWK